MKRERNELLANQYNDSFKPGNVKYQVSLIADDQPEFTIINEKEIQASTGKYSFDSIFSHKTTNEMIYKELFPELVPQFLAGQSLMIQIIGNKNSGKAKIAIGNVRNPGLLLLIIQEIFNYIEEKFLENQITIKLSAYKYDQNGFKDLLIVDQPLKPVTINSQNQLLGIPEVILENYLLAMKLLHIAMANLAQDQNLNGYKFVEAHKNTTVIFEIKAEISPSDDLKEQIIISKLKLVKYSHNFEFGSIYKTMSDLCNKTRKHIEVPFRSVELLDYFRDFLLNQAQTIIYCIQDLDNLKQANQLTSILNKNLPISFSIYQQNTQLKEIAQNQKESLFLFTKEFQQVTESKKERGRIIFNIASQLSKYFTKIMTFMDKISEVKYKLNCLYSQMISYHCSKYENIINTEDYKEFYLAKIQQYAIDQIKQVHSQIKPHYIQLLQELYENQITLFQTKKEQARFQKSIINNTILTQFDQQRFSNTIILQNKLLNIFDVRLGYNILNQIDPKFFNLYTELLQLHAFYKIEAIQIEEVKVDLQSTKAKVQSPKFFKPVLPVKPPHPQKQKFTDVIQQLFHDDNTREFYSSKPIFNLTNLNPDQQQFKQTVKSNLFEQLQMRSTQNIRGLVIELQQKKYLWYNYRFFQKTGVGFLKSASHHNLNRAQSQMLPRLKDL